MDIAYFSDASELKTIAFRLGLSFLLAFIVGFERERQSQPAGLRTHVLISIGSAMFMLISIRLPELFAGRYQSDPARIAAQIVTGVGFLGAGAIIKTGINVKGLTTAANVWVVAAIGMAVGGGFYFAAFILTGLSLVTLIPLNLLEGLFIRGRIKKKLLLRFADKELHIAEIESILDKHEIEIKNISIVESLLKDFTELELDIHISKQTDIKDVFTDLRGLDNLLKIELANQ